MVDFPAEVEIDVHRVQALVQAGEPLLLLDCREPQEHAMARIEGARLIPLGQLVARVAELEPHRDQRIIVYCHHGGRSEQATHWLRQQGFAGAQNMSGGIDAWSLQVDPRVPRYR